MNGNGLGPMNDGNGWCSNPNFTGFGGRGRSFGFGIGRGMGRGFSQPRGMGQGFGMGQGRGFGQGFGMGRGMGPGRGMGFVNGAPGYGNRVAFANQNQAWGGGWTAPANEKSEDK